MGLDNPTVVTGQNVQFSYDMASSSKKSRNKKKKSKPSIKELQSAPPLAVETESVEETHPQAELYDSEADYPSSRVIRRAANGDVIVESLNEAGSGVQAQQAQQQKHSAISSKLVAHWESLSPEEKRKILSISKEEVFSVTKSYQTLHNCNCTVCGRRHVPMEQELESIYNQLYEMARQDNPNSDFVLFHLNLIKELQRGTSSGAEQRTASLQSRGASFLDNMRDEAVKYCISNEGVDRLKEEVLQFKHNKQRQYSEQQRKQQVQSTHTHNTSSCSPSVDELPEREQESLLHTLPEELGPDSSEVSEELREKYLKFAKTFVSSHPKIAQEYVNRMMMYPDMRALTEDLIKNNGQDFVKAMEAFVSSQQDGPLPGSPEHTKLTAEQFQELQKQLIEKAGLDMSQNTAPTNTDSPEDCVDMDENGNEVRERVLFKQFMAGENIIDQAFKSLQGNNKNQLKKSVSHSSQGLPEDSEYDEDLNYSDSYDDEDSPYDDDVYDDNDAESYDEDDDSHHKHHHQQHLHHHHREQDAEADDYDSDIDQQERLEEGRGLIQIAITKLLQRKLIVSYQEKQAERNRERLLLELEAEEQQKKEKEEKKLKKKEKEKEKKRQMQLAKEEEKRKQVEEEARLKLEAEAREMQRRENQRKKVEEAKRKKDLEMRKRLEEQRRREEEQERQRRMKEEVKRKRDQERKQREEEQRRKKQEKELKKQQSLEVKKKREEDDKPTEEQYQEDNLHKENISQDPLSQLPHPAGGVPYGIVPVKQELSEEKTVNDDIFNMINEATSKSISTSPSHFNALLQKSIPRKSVDAQSIGLNYGSAQASLPQQLGFPVDLTEALGFAQKTQVQTAISGPPGLSQNTAASSWDNVPGYVQLSPKSVTQSHSNAQVQTVQHGSVPGQHRASYSTFGTSVDPNDTFTGELTNLTNFLVQTKLEDVSTSAPLHSVSSSTTALPRGDTSIYGNNLWNNEQPHIGSLISSHASGPSTQAPLHPRRSIWDNNATMNNYAADLWGNTSSNSTPVAPSTAVASSMVSAHQASATDVIIQAYTLLSTSGGFVPIDILYQNCLTYLTDKGSFTFGQFVGQLLALRNANECEVLSNDVGMMTHCRFTAPQLHSTLYSPVAAAGGSDLPPRQPSKGIFSDAVGTSTVGLTTIPVLSTSTGSTSSATPTGSIALGQPSSGQSNFFDFNQQLAQTSRANNIWG
ncbi:AaceriACL086Cp [[Ashbya] aceris (nom. inval.)]|nr:AaceriACL086Cp [[Ashbya] aceris (nom. inval.)]